MRKENKIISVFKKPRLAILFVASRLSRYIKSDALYYQLQYYSFTGKWLNIEHPKTYVEKMQWLKVHDRNPLYTTMVDKYAAKEYVANIIGTEYIIPTLGVWNTPEQIEWEKLPDQFVLKATHGGGALDVVICKDKSNFDKAAACRKLSRSLRSDFWRMREYQYKDVPRRIIAEQYLEEENGSLTDYKVMCFNGEAKMIQVHRNRFTHQTQDLYGTDWKKINIWQRGYPNSDTEAPKPTNLDKMLELSRIMSKGLAQIRIDWYDVNGHLYFGELTLTDGGGFSDWATEEWDAKVASWIKLPIDEE